jgi:hypothetical protein
MEDVAAALADGEADALPGEEVAVVGNAEIKDADGATVDVGPPEHAVVSRTPRTTANTLDRARRCPGVVIA